MTLAKDTKGTDYDGSKCPYCHSQNILAIEQVQMDGEVGSQSIECHDCGKLWYDIVTLAGWEPESKDDIKPAKDPRNGLESITDVQIYAFEALLKVLDEDYPTLANKAMERARWYGYPIPSDYKDMTPNEAAIIIAYAQEQVKAKEQEKPYDEIF